MVVSSCCSGQVAHQLPERLKVPRRKGAIGEWKWVMQPTNVFFFFGGGVWWKQHGGYPVVGRERFGAIHIPFQTETQGKTINVLVLARTRALRKWRPKVEQQKYAGRCLKWKSIISLPQPRYCWSSAEQKDGTATHIILYIYMCYCSHIYLSIWRFSLVPLKIVGSLFPTSHFNPFYIVDYGKKLLNSSTILAPVLFGTQTHVRSCTLW